MFVRVIANQDPLAWRRYMNIGKIVGTAAVVGVAVNVYDFLVHGLLLQGMMYADLPIMRQDASLPALIGGDFVAALVLVWVYDRVRSSFSSGAAGGATFGFYAGVLTAFPTFIFFHLVLVDYPYGLAWAGTFAQVGWAILGGAVAGLMYARGGEVAA